MKLKEVITENNNNHDDSVQLMEAFESASKAFTKVKTGAKDIGSGAKDFFKAHPALSVGAAAIALNAYSNYKKSQRNTLKLYAKDSYEKKMMTDIVDVLTKSGRFRLKKSKYEQGGHSWELVKK